MTLYNVYDTYRRFGGEGCKYLQVQMEAAGFSEIIVSVYQQ